MSHLLPTCRGLVMIMWSSSPCPKFTCTRIPYPQVQIFGRWSRECEKRGRPCCGCGEGPVLLSIGTSCSNSFGPAGVWKGECQLTDPEDSWNEKQENVALRPGLLSLREAAH